MQSSLDADVLDCFDAGLESIGTAPKKMVYWYMLEKCKLPRDKIPENPEGFLTGLRQLFGQGAGVLEKTIVWELKQKFKITLGDDLVEVLSLVMHAVRPSRIPATPDNRINGSGLPNERGLRPAIDQTARPKRSHSH